MCVKYELSETIPTMLTPLDQVSTALCHSSILCIIFSIMLICLQLMFPELNFEFIGDVERSIRLSYQADKINELYSWTTICNLSNKIFDLGYFSEDWSKGYTISLH